MSITTFLAHVVLSAHFPRQVWLLHICLPELSRLLHPSHECTITHIHTPSNCRKTTFKFYPVVAKAHDELTFS